MAENSSRTPGMFDPEKLMAAQRRNMEALTSAGQIVADGMRTCAERQAAMVQDAMRGLWGEMQTTGRSGAAVADPSEQLARMRAAFDRVLAQVQELSQLLLRVQSEAMSVLNSCAAANMEALGGMAPDLASLQKMAAEAMETATRQVSTAVDEMRARMMDLQDETRRTAGAGIDAGAAAAGAGAAAAGAGVAAAEAGTRQAAHTAASAAEGATEGARTSGRRGGSTKS